MSYDEATGEQAYKKIVQLFRTETDEWYHIRANGEEIVCTGGHPFYVADEGFVCAKDLKVGNLLLLSNGNRVKIEDIRIEKLLKPEIKYNFEVEDFHTYYVTESNVLVHNICEPSVPEDYEVTKRFGEYQQSSKHPTRYELGHEPSPGPSQEVGQYFLDNSVPAAGKSTARLAYSKEKDVFIIFKKTSEGVYHGYYNSFNQFRNFSNLSKVASLAVKVGV